MVWPWNIKYLSNLWKTSPLTVWVSKNTHVDEFTSNKTFSRVDEGVYACKNASISVRQHRGTKGISNGPKSSDRRLWLLCFGSFFYAPTLQKLLPGLPSTIFASFDCQPWLIAYVIANTHSLRKTVVCWRRALFAVCARRRWTLIACQKVGRNRFNLSRTELTLAPPEFKDPAGLDSSHREEED